MYSIEFEYNDENLSFSDKGVRETVGHVIDWLYDNGYKFEGPIHKAFTKKLVSMSDIQNSESSDYYLKRMRQFWALKSTSDSKLLSPIDRYISVVNKEPALELVKNMLGNFGVDISTIKSSGFGDDEESESEITPYTRMFTKSKQSQDVPEEELSEELPQLPTQTPNPFGGVDKSSAICILGESGVGKTTTTENYLSDKKHEYEVIIPSSTTTSLLAQYSPSNNKYVLSRLGRLLLEARNNPTQLYLKHTYYYLVNIEQLNLLLLMMVL